MSEKHFERIDPRERQEVLDGFKRAIGDIWSRDGQNTWPIEINSIVHLFMGRFFDEFHNDMVQLEEKGLRREEIAARLRTSARIIRLVMPCVLGMKDRKITMEEQRQHVMELLSLVKYLKSGDLFNRDGKNAVLSRPAFEQSVQPSQMASATRKESLMVHKLCGILWTYAETVCFKVHGLIREFHGPYSFPGGSEEILIRDFLCLNPVELWDRCEAVPYSNVRVVTAYEGLDMTVDIYNNVTIKEGASYMGSLKSFYVEADGERLSMDQINRLSSTLSQAMIDIATGIEEMEWRQLAKKYAEIFWFSKKELRDELELDWRPPDVVNRQIEEGALNERLQSMSPKGLQRLIRIAF
ncbi:MAG: hypothetical protein GY940_36920 [bacterium]|nr:hypothetical protein [bacterium]